MEIENQNGAGYRLLPRINSPADLRTLSIPQLTDLAAEIRRFLVESVSKTGGHLGPGLGTVELAIAIHYVFDTPRDRVVWDVGHQAYPHKILTGRRDRFDTLRKLGGISGFLKRSESEYDVFGAGHASTAVSAALGIATARDFAGESYRVLAVVGDGSMTGGMAYEGMNNAGLLRKDMTVILNDNNMSISPNVWALSKHFTEIIAHPSYNKLKRNVWEFTGHFDQFGDRVRQLVARMQEGVKVIITPGMLFEALGFRYFGPMNGHNLPKLIRLFQYVKEMKGPLLLHITTEKGKGYRPAEEDEEKLHGVNPFDVETGKSNSKPSSSPTYTAVFGDAICSLARKDRRIVGITAAMAAGTGLDRLQEEFPDRFFDVGIAEQHAVTFAAGLAVEGYIPVAAIYSTFLQRGFDQVIHDVALQHLHVVFALDRAGLVGADGPTHHGTFDLSYLRCIPGIVLMAPKDENELRDMLATAIAYTGGPVAIRYPRGSGTGAPLREDFREIPIGAAEVLREGADGAIIAIGNMVQPSLQAAETLAAQGLSLAVVNARFAKPLDEETMARLAARFSKFITVEDNVVVGGFGSGVVEWLQAHGHDDVHVRVHGIPDSFIEQGSPQELYHMLKLDAEGIAGVVKECLRDSATRTADVSSAKETAADVPSIPSHSS